jgi:hypothetical protein
MKKGLLLGVVMMLLIPSAGYAWHRHYYYAPYFYAPFAYAPYPCVCTILPVSLLRIRVWLRLSLSAVSVLLRLPTVPVLALVKEAQR